MMPQSARVLTTTCLKPVVPLEDSQESITESLTLPLHKDPGIQDCHCSHPPVWCRDLGSLSEVDQATGVVSLTLLALHSWHQMARPHVKRWSPQESQHRVHLASGVAALGWPRHKDGRRTHAQSSLLQQAPRRKAWSWCSKKALQRSADETACTGGNQPSVMAAGGLRPRQLVLISEKSQLWVRGREAERHGAAKEKRWRQKEWAAFVPSSSQTFVCLKCGRGCASRIGLYSHQQACKNWPSTFPTILVCEELVIMITIIDGWHQRLENQNLTLTHWWQDGDDGPGETVSAVWNLERFHWFCRLLDSLCMKSEELWCHPWLCLVHETTNQHSVQGLLVSHQMQTDV